MSKYWIAMYAAVIFNVGANYMFKIGMQSTEIGLSMGALKSMILNVWLWLGGFSAVLLLGSYLYAIKGVPLSSAYPIVTGGAMVGIALVAALSLNEVMAPGKLAGIALVIVGVGMITHFSS